MQQEKYVVVAEKASVARAIRRALAELRVDAVVTSVRGHMLDADLPRGYGWNQAEPLAIIRLRSLETRVVDQESYERLRQLFAEDRTLVIATDNDSEGELIGYEILMVYRAVRGDDAPFRRMRFNSISRNELMASWRSLEEGLKWSWVEKARYRQHFDLLTGASFTRLLTINTRRKRWVRLVSWGSCQIPCLNFVVEREKEITSFKPRKYWYVKAIFETASGEKFHARTESFWSREEVGAVWEAVSRANEGEVREYLARREVIPRPLPIRTDDMLRDLTRITGLSAQRLLGIMEDLYAEGYLSYPRTDTNRYGPSFDFSVGVRAVLEAGIVKQGREVAPHPRNGRLDDGAHPPIYPTSAYSGGGLPRTVWEYAARRFYANAFMEDAEATRQKALVAVGDVIFKAEGSYISSQGFYGVFSYFRPRDNKLPSLSRGEKLKVAAIDLVEEETKPPPRLSEADLLRLMERHGIGTDATRAVYPALILERGYAKRVRGVFHPTPLGLTLIESLSSADKSLATPETRRMVDENMERIERGVMSYEEALESSARRYEQLLITCKERIEDIAAKLAQAVQPEERTRDFTAKKAASTYKNNRRSYQKRRR